MKKLFSIFLSLLYLVLSLGFTKNTHICKGIKQEISFFGKNKEGQPCSKCAIKNGKILKGCCEHKTQLLKIIEKSQKTATEKISFVRILDASLPQASFQTVFVDYFPEQTAPPFSALFTAIPIRNFILYIYYCVYRI